MTTEQRRLAAIVSADGAGYSRLMGRDESGTLAPDRSKATDRRLTQGAGPRLSLAKAARRQRLRQHRGYGIFSAKSSP
jgi:hypothetical protein